VRLSLLGLAYSFLTSLSPRSNHARLPYYQAGAGCPPASWCPILSAVQLSLSTARCVGYEERLAYGSDHLDRGLGKPLPGFSDGELYVDRPNREVRLRGRRVSLSPIEFRLLACLVCNAGAVVPHKSLLSEVWGPDYAQDIRSLELYIRYLRQKIEPNPGQQCYILTEWGVSYRFREVSSSARASVPTLHMGDLSSAFGA